MNKYIQIQTDLGNLLPRPVFLSLVVKLSFSGAKTYHYCVIPREQSDRGNLIVQCSSVSYGFRICSTQYIEIATPPSVARNDTCGAEFRQCAKLSFSGAKTFHCCVILSGAVEDSAVEESSAYPIAATRKILRLRSG